MARNGTLRGEMLRRRKAAADDEQGAIGVAAERFAARITVWTGSTVAFSLALGTIVLWAILGPVFRYSDTWQLVINTGTTIVTFLMVFLIQRAQNKDALAIQLKLNEIVAAVKGASNRLISVEDLTENELEMLHRHYQRLGALSKRTEPVRESHSVDEATRRHRAKHDKNEDAQS